MLRLHTKAACGPRFIITSVTLARPLLEGCQVAQARVHCPGLIRIGSVPPLLLSVVPPSVAVGCAGAGCAATWKLLPPCSSTFTCEPHIKEYK